MTGRATLCRRLGQWFRYLNDETVGIAEGGALLPYAKPRSVRRTAGLTQKDELSPDDLGLRPAPTAPRVGRIVVLVRDLELGSVDIQELTLMDAPFAVVKTSSLSRLVRPLQRLGKPLETAGPVLRVRSAEASDIEGELAKLNGSAA